MTQTSDEMAMNVLRCVHGDEFAEKALKYHTEYTDNDKPEFEDYALSLCFHQMRDRDFSTAKLPPFRLQDEDDDYGFGDFSIDDDYEAVMSEAQDSADADLVNVIVQNYAGNDLWTAEPVTQEDKINEAVEMLVQRLVVYMYKEWIDKKQYHEPFLTVKLTQELEKAFPNINHVITRGENWAYNVYGRPEDVIEGNYRSQVNLQEKE